MEITTNTVTQRVDAGDMMRTLRQRRNTPPRFRLPLTMAQAAAALLDAYSGEVERRSRTLVQDDSTLANIDALATFLTSDSPKFGVMLCGTPGNGKTTLAHSLAVVINSYNLIPMTIINARNIAYYSQNAGFINDISDAGKLAIDDLGMEPTEVVEYGNVLNPIIDLIEYRYLRQLFTLVTTNLTAEQIRKKYGNRIADRFNEMLEVIVFKNQSYR